MWIFDATGKTQFYSNFWDYLAYTLLRAWKCPSDTLRVKRKKRSRAINSIELYAKLTPQNKSRCSCVTLTTIVSIKIISRVFSSVETKRCRECATICSRDKSVSRSIADEPSKLNNETFSFLQILLTGTTVHANEDIVRNYAEEAISRTRFERY